MADKKLDVQFVIMLDLPEYHEMEDGKPWEPVTAEDKPAEAKRKRARKVADRAWVKIRDPKFLRPDDAELLELRRAWLAATRLDGDVGVERIIDVQSKIVDWIVLDFHVPGCDFLPQPARHQVDADYATQAIMPDSTVLEAHKR